jgi:hypothetical protein
MQAQVLFPVTIFEEVQISARAVEYHHERKG